MLLSELSLVRAAHIVLASASPRRSLILNEQLKLNARAVPSAFEENLSKSGTTPEHYVMETARGKALDVYSKCEAPFLSQHGRTPSLVVGADTVVVLDGEILEKPQSTDDARRMLSALSAAKVHSVHTGVSLIYGGGDFGSAPYEHTFSEATQVEFKALSDAEIETYVASGEPMDKSGAYGIQGLGSAFVTGIVGDYQNVVGFPAARFLQELDVARLSAWVEAPEERAAPPPSPPDDDDEYIISDECGDDEECGLPSD